jgi:hypothetical protein
MFFLAFRGRLDAHRRLGRITLPIWLYVSVTGVVIYVMLYHLYPAAEPAAGLVGRPAEPIRGRMNLVGTGEPSPARFSP